LRPNAEGLDDLVHAARIPLPEQMVLTAPPDMIQLPSSDMPLETDSGDAELMLKYYGSLNQLIVENSPKTVLSFLDLPQLPKRITPASTEVFSSCMDALTDNLRTTVLMKKGEKSTIISRDI
jgi:hypothetical protein